MVKTATTQPVTTPHISEMPSTISWAPESGGNIETTGEVATSSTVTTKMPAMSESAKKSADGEIAEARR